MAPRSRDSEGNATLRLELPVKTMSRLRHNTPSVHQRRSYACWCARVAVAVEEDAMCSILAATDRYRKLAIVLWCQSLFCVIILA